jgi:DNA-binding NtrC family response regulator
VRKFDARLRKHVSRIEPDALAMLLDHPWPGNIRELENVIERAVLFCDGDALRTIDLPNDLHRTPDPASTAPASKPPALINPAASDGLKEQVKAAMNRLERELIVKALEQTGGNVTHAARLLKISRKGLQLKMKELGLRERDERTDP